MYKEDFKELINNQLTLCNEIKEKKASEEDIAKFRENDKKILAEFSINLNDTIDYYNQCNADELSLLSILIIDLTNHFRSNELVNCFEKRIAKLEDKLLKKCLENELDFIKSSLNI